MSMRTMSTLGLTLRGAMDMTNDQGLEIIRSFPLPSGWHQV